jgi:Raf kinase inhibitor-like YbhB/YbcL family protein
LILGILILNKHKITEVKMQISSTAFQNNAAIPTKYTCDGERISPPLAFSDIPAETKSLALILDDPDAPSGEFVHWVVFNLPPETTTIAEDQTPAGIVGKNSGNQNNYFPPCPPSGQHHYKFSVYALDLMLNLDAKADKKNVLAAMQNHILAQGELIGLYR